MSTDRSGQASGGAGLHEGVLRATRGVDRRPRITGVLFCKRAGRDSTPQPRINQLIIEHALALDPSGDDLVVRLKGGDPLIFARAQEEIEALQAHGIAFGVAPGITAAQAGFAALGSPMTRRGQRRAVVLATPQVQAGEAADLAWARPLLGAGGGALYMAAGCAARVRATLLVLGMPADLPAAWITDASRPQQQIRHTTLGHIDRDAPANGPPALLVLGVGATTANAAARSEALALTLPADR